MPQKNPMASRARALSVLTHSLLRVAHSLLAAVDQSFAASTRGSRKDAAEHAASHHSVHVVTASDATDCERCFSESWSRRRPSDVARSLVAVAVTVQPWFKLISTVTQPVAMS
eukprot:2806087-Rhodomonas_salina.2